MYSPLRRHALGVMALLLMTPAIVLPLVLKDDLSEMNRNLCGIALRAGMTLAAAWLALPQIVTLSVKCPPRLLIAIAAGCIVVIARPRSFPLVLLIIGVLAVLEFVGWLLKPLPRGKTKARNSSDPAAKR
jgi:hypothetical protein